MATTSVEQQSGFMTPAEAREYYDLSIREAAPANALEAELTTQGVAKIHMPLRDNDFKQLITAYETSIADHPGLLAESFYELDQRFGYEVGNQRREQKFDTDTAVQIADPKNYIHFTEGCQVRWGVQFAHAPRAFRDFLQIGYSLHQELVQIGRECFAGLEPNHPNISRAHFTGRDSQPMSRTFLRLISYDGYAPAEGMGAVAKPHFDIGAMTIQAYADAPGFWGAVDNKPETPRTYYDTHDSEAYLFAGTSHQKLYGSADPINPLWHGVDRIVPEGTTWVPKRHTVVMFYDAPLIDYGVKPGDTVPYNKDFVG